MTPQWKDRASRPLVLGMFSIGLLSYVIMLRLTRSPEGVDLDERDRSILARASTVQLWAVFMTLAAGAIDGRVSMAKAKITNQIRRLRFEHDEMTQQELATKVGCTRQTIIVLEQERYVPSLALAFRIAKIFGRSVDETFSFEAD